MEPQEDNKVVFLPVAAPTEGKPSRGMLAFRVTVRNTDLLATVKLEKLRVSFPGSAAPSRTFDREVTVQPGKTATLSLNVADSIELEAPFPPKVRIGFQAEGFGEFQEFDRTLAAHVSPVTGGAYKLPFRPEDLTQDEYIVPIIGHGGNQHFAYDLESFGWNADTATFEKFKAGTDGSKNQDRFGWKKPVHAMADGIVLNHINKYPDNPVPDKNFVLRTAEDPGGPTTSFDIAALTTQAPFRMVSAVRTESGLLKLIVLEQSKDGESLTRIGWAEGQLALAESIRISVAALSPTRAVTALTDGGTSLLTLWSISADGKTIGELGGTIVPEVEEVKIEALSSKRLALVSRTAEKRLAVAVWKVNGNALSEERSELGGKVGELDLAVLDPTRLATAIQTEGGRLKLIVWSLVLDSGDKLIDLTRKSGPDQDGITAVAVSLTAVATRLATAVRTSAGRLQLSTWDLAEDGTPSEADSFEHEKVSQQITLIQFKKQTVLTAVQNGDGDLRVFLWAIGKDDGTLRLSGEGKGAGTDLIRMAMIDTPHTTAATAVRSEGGELEIILWQLAHSNLLQILHGKVQNGVIGDAEVVLYAHLNQDLQKPPLVPGTFVASGQLLGRMGNSGASSEPHLHVHAAKAPQGMKLADLIQQIQDDTWDEGPYRPLIFRQAEAMLLQPVQPGGIGVNPFFAPMKGQGAYFASYAIWPK